MTVNFEEKTYESYFNSELDKVSEIYFPLGQVQEGSLGFDSASFSTNRKLWQRLGLPLYLPLSGIELKEIAEEMEYLLGITLKMLPKIKVNLLFQYKRPEYMERENSKEWGHWNEPYFRYDIYRDQQELLMQIKHQFGDKIFIVYACPAISDVNDLVKAFLKKEIINISNFRKASELDKHHRNTFIQAGTYSIGCSEPEKIDNFDLIKTIESLSGEATNIEKSNRESILDFRKQLVALMTKNEYYSTSFLQLNEQYSLIEEYELLYSHLVLNNFRLLTGTQWLVKL